MNAVLIGKTADAAARWWANRLYTGDKGIFQQTLKHRIIDEFVLYKKKMLRISCDYEPDEFLGNILRDCGILYHRATLSGNGVLPMKHATTIRPGEIEPKEGHANFTEIIYVE